MPEDPKDYINFAMPYVTREFVITPEFYQEIQSMELWKYSRTARIALAVNSF